MGNFLNAKIGDHIGDQKVKQIILYVVVIYLAYRVIRFLLWLYRFCRSRSIGKKMRSQRDAKNFKFEQISDSLQQKLIEMDVTQLRQGLMAGDFTSVDLVNFFGSRSQKYGRELCLSTEELFEPAMQMAIQCDKERQAAIQKNEQDKLSFLHGIPISIKELIWQKGMLSTVGCAQNNDRMKMDAPCLFPVLQSGAIPLVRGNLPQAALSIHSDNFIWGRAQNPYDRSRSCGGSSGGDAGLVCARCVPLAIGTDLASSIRVPSTLNGIIGFKPTQGRFSAKGCMSARVSRFDHLSGYWDVTTGPLARSTNDCIEFFKILCTENAHLFDPWKPSAPFNKQMFDQTIQKNEKIKVGVVTEVPFLPVSPAVKRAIQISRKALEQAGYEVVDYPITQDDLDKAKNYLIAMIANLTVKYLAKDFHATGEQLVIGIQTQLILFGAGPILHSTIRGILKMIGMGRSSLALANARVMDDYEFEKLNSDRIEFSLDYSKRWQASGISALVMPSFPTCTFRAQHADDMGLMCDYTWLWNILSYPAGTMPITQVQDNEQTYEDSYNDGWSRLLRETARDSVGLPVSIQVVAHSYEDEKALAVMQDIEKQVKYKIPVPQSVQTAGQAVQSMDINA